MFNASVKNNHVANNATPPSQGAVGEPAQSCVDILTPTSQDTVPGGLGDMEKLLEEKKQQLLKEVEQRTQSHTSQGNEPVLKSLTTTRDGYL